MPFQSAAQRRFMWSQHPEIAREWTEKYGSKVQPSTKNTSTRTRKKPAGKRKG